MPNLPGMSSYDNTLQDFLTHLQLERGASPHTVEAYRRDLIDLGDFTEHADPDLLQVSVLDDYAVALSDRGLSPATVRRRLAAVRAFLKHRAREGARADAGRTVALPRLGRRLPEPLTKAEAEAIVTRPDGSPRGSARPSDARAVVRSGSACIRACLAASLGRRSRRGHGAVYGQGSQAAGGADG